MVTYYPDIAHFQAGLSLRGAQAVIAKATQGTTFNDPSYASFKAQAAQLGVLFGAYHWVDTSDLAAQAAHAHAAIGSTPTMWDAEAPGSTVPRLLELTSRYRALGGVVHLVYLPRWWWRDHIGAPDLRPLRDAGLALVSSAYPTGGYSDSGSGWDPYGGVTPSIWQYTDKQPFNGRSIDFNAFRGTVEQLRAVLNGGSTMSTGSEVWHDYGITSDSLGITALPPEEILKQMYRVNRPNGPADQILAAVQSLGVQVANLATAVAAIGTASGMTPEQSAALNAAVSAAAKEGAAEGIDGATLRKPS